MADHVNRVDPLYEESTLFDYNFDMLAFAWCANCKTKEPVFLVDPKYQVFTHHAFDFIPN
jgi:hypothetical protein